MTSVRSARPADAQAMARIYNAGVEERQATLETVPLSAADFAARIELGDRWPTIVAEQRGPVVGWAVGDTPWTPVRRRLLEALAAEAERAGYWKLIGRLFPENEPSRALLRGCGFSEVGVHRRHGRLDGEWRDVLIVERLLGEAAD